VFPHPHLILTPSRKHAAKTWYHCPVISFILEHDEGLLLWETGASPTATAEWPDDWQELVDLSGITPEGCLEARLRAHGLGPEDFTHVVMGHLHADHAGGLRLFESTSAEIVCHEDEYRHVMGIEKANDFFVRDDWGFLASRKPTTVYADMEILKGVSVVSLPGHTPGTMGLKLQLPHTGNILLTSDALFTHWSYGPPAVGSPIVWDAGKWAASVERIRRLASAEDVLLMPGHDLTGIRHEGETFRLDSVQFSPDYVYE
jgi:N-acyl homoserine lactone hydrolase